MFLSFNEQNKGDGGSGSGLGKEGFGEKREAGNLSHNRCFFKAKKKRIYFIQA
jgi:hypothetical protein